MLASRLLILAAAALWSTAGAAIKLCELSGWQIAGARSLVAGLFLAALIPAARRRPDRGVWLTAVAYALTVVSFAVANKLTTSANAIFIQDTAPLWILVLSPRLLGERPSRAELSSVPVYAFGLLLFFMDELAPGQLTGNLVALASGVAFAVCIMGLRRVGERGPNALVYGNLIAAFVTLPLWMTGPPPTGLDLAIVGYLGVFQLGLSYLCFARGVAHTPALEASLLALLEPVLNPIWAFWLVGERPGPWALLGGSIILCATTWRTLAPLWERRRAAQI